MFSFFPAPLQTVEMAELWGVIISLQAFVLVFFGIDNLKVFKFVSELLDGSEWFKPLPLHKDGDLIDKTQGTLETRSRSTVKVAKVICHAADEMVAGGTVRWRMVKWNFDQPKAELILLYEIWLGFLTLLHFGQGDGWRCCRFPGKHVSCFD